jgi:hypothetical protein
MLIVVITMTYVDGGDNYDILIVVITTTHFDCGDNYDTF